MRSVQISLPVAAEFLGIPYYRDGKIKVHVNPMNQYRLFKVRDLERLLAKIEKSGRK